MSTPSQRLWARRDEWGEPGLPRRLDRVGAPPLSLAATAQRIAAGLALRDAVADFLDDLHDCDAAEVGSRVAAEPSSLDPRADAYLAAVAEHLAAAHRLPAPSWVLAPGRFLEQLWWPSKTAGLRARAVVESPAAFRRRGIFIGATTLARV